jgi:hypothetical protein
MRFIFASFLVLSNFYVIHAEPLTPTPTRSACNAGQVKAVMQCRDQCDEAAYQCISRCTGQSTPSCRPQCGPTHQACMQNCTKGC